MQDHTGETEDTEDTDYSDVLSLEHAYYNVLQPKMMLLPTVFRIP